MEEDVSSFESSLIGDITGSVTETLISHQEFGLATVVVTARQKKKKKKKKPIFSECEICVTVIDADGNRTTLCRPVDCKKAEDILK